MSAKTHPRAVGVFVLIAVGLLLTAIVLLGSQGWFVPTNRYSVFFPGSVRGLNRGAEVTFRGVRIGEVVDVRAILTGQPEPLIQIEAVLEIRGDVVRVPEGRVNPFRDLSAQAFAEAVIERGLRARMLSASLLTGQRYIELDFLPDQPARFAGLEPRHPELPTTPTAFEKLGDQAELFFDKLAELPLDEMLDDVRAVIQSLRATVDSEELRGAFASADRTMKDLEPTLEQMRETMTRLDDLATAMQAEASRTGEDARQSLESFRATLERAQESLASVDATLGAADDTRLQASRTLAELEETLRVMRNLAEYIQTHPEAFVLGKSGAEEEE